MLGLSNGKAKNYTDGKWLKYVKALPDNEGYNIKSAIVVSVKNKKIIILIVLCPNSYCSGPVIVENNEVLLNKDKKDNFWKFCGGRIRS